MPRTAVFAPDSPLSLIIGVTGHRDLRDEDIPRLEATLDSVFLDLSRSYPASSAVLLTALAEGADRLAARVALRMGIQLIVPLPLPQDLYERDFEAPGSLDEFRELLSRAAGVVPLPLLPGSTGPGIQQHGPVRDQEYAKVGAYIAHHSQIFIALWDGSVDETDKLGGTAYTVRVRLEGAPGSYTSRRGRLTSATSTGPVVHIETPRRGATDTASSSSTAWRLLLPALASEKSFERICGRIDGYNRDARTLRTEIEHAGGTSKAQLVNAEPVSLAALSSSLPASCRRIMEQYAIADILALHFRSHALATWKRVSVGVAVAALLFNMHSSFFFVGQGVPVSVRQAAAEMPWFLIAFLAWSAFTAIWLLGRARRGEYQTKYQDYRALAEALRIQFFWSIAGLDEPVVDSYLRKQKSELEWIRGALLSCNVWVASRGSSRAAGQPMARRLEIVAEWIREQRRYFTSKAKSEAIKLEREITIIEWLLKLSVGLSVVLALLLAMPMAEALIHGSALMRTVPSDRQHELFMVVIPMLAVVAGLLHGYGNQLARPEHVRQFGRMSELFYAAERELQTLLSENLDEDAIGLIRELGLEALDENGDWLTLHRERPLEVPPG